MACFSERDRCKFQKRRIKKQNYYYESDYSGSSSAVFKDDFFILNNFKTNEMIKK
jgi:hypothetical protein